MVDYPQTDEEMKVREYFNKLGNLSEKAIQNYVTLLGENYKKHLQNHQIDSLYEIKEKIGNSEISFFSKMNYLERLANEFKNVEEELGWFESIGFRKDFNL